MKKTLLPILALAASLTLFSCCQSCSKKPYNVTDDNGKTEDIDDGKPKAGEYTFTVSPLKGQWEAGDQIYVHGSYGPAAQTITLQASNISADGKTASVKIETGLEYLSAPDYLYAAWPASCVREEDGLMDASTTFVKADGLIAQAYLEGKTFRFEDASALISFSVSGDYDRVAIAGKQRPGLRFTEYTNPHSSAKTSFNKVATDGYPFREAALTGGKADIWFPGGIALDGGFTLYLGKDGAWPKSYTYVEHVNLQAGKALELGDITASLANYKGPAPKMPEMVKKTKYTLKFNELSGLCLSSDSDFLWAVGDGSEIAKIGIDGTLIAKAGLKTTTGSTIDSEAISLNFDNGDLIIGGEPASVCRIPYEKIGEIFQSNTFKGVESLFTIDHAKNFGNSGLEGITYYGSSHCYAGAQTGSYLYLCNMNNGNVITVKNLREKFPVITEIAGLSYDPLTDWLWIVDSESHRFFALTGEGDNLLGYYSCKGIGNPESICVDHKHGCIWIGDDDGSTSYLYRYDFTGLDDFNK